MSDKKQEDLFDFAKMAKEFYDQFAVALQKELNELEKPNILVVGRTGVGKSSLINAVFGKEIAPVGSGRPITANYQKYDEDGSLVTIYDSAGWLAGAANEEEFYKNTKTFLQQVSSFRERIHVVWYVVDAPGARFTDFDRKLIRELYKDLPVIFVLTKGEIASDEQVFSIVEEIEESGFPNNLGIIDVCAAPQKRRGIWTGTIYNLDVLVQTTLGLLPEIVKRAFVAAQIVDLKTKDHHANIAIGTAATAAAGIGATSIPFSDWPFLVGVQATMTAALATIYGFSSKKVSTFGTGLAGAFTTMWIGKAVVDLLRIWLLPLAPIGQAIDATVAASMTWIMGKAVAALFHETIKLSVEENFHVTPEWAESFLSSEISKLWKRLKKLGPRKFIKEMNQD